MTMLCNFQDLQAESSPVLFKAEVGKRFNFARTVAKERDLLSDNEDDVQNFCRVREEQLRLYLIFTSIKMHIFGKQSTKYSFS